MKLRTYLILSFFLSIGIFKKEVEINTSTLCNAGLTVF